MQKRILLAALVMLLGFHQSARGVDLWQHLKKVFERPGSKAVEAPMEPLRAALELFSDQHELEIGRQLAGTLLGAAPLVSDFKLQQYINRVGRWVADRSDRSSLVWRFGVIDSPDINAFAVPGGYVFVTKGLYRRLQDESELAGVLGHEIAHVSKKHHLRLMAQTGLIEQGSKMLEKTVGDGEEIKRLIGTGAEVFARALDQRAEFEADRMAVVLAARAAYDPFGLPVVLQDLARVPKDESRIALLFKTHPHPDDRLAQLDNTVGNRLDVVKGSRLASRFHRLTQ